MTDPIAVLARWLGGHIEWMRHRQEADEFLADVEACSRVVRSIVRGPVAQRYLGPCGAESHCTGLTASWCPTCGDCACPDDGIPELHIAPTLDDPRCPLHGERSPHPASACLGDVYAREGAQNGACRDCGSQVSTAERRAWLDAEVRSQAFRASEIEDAYQVPAGTIRVWATRGVLSVHGHDTQGRALYLLSHVLDVAATRAAQRATEQAKRARRAAVKAEDERLSA